jgi:hypothetical protein
MKHLNPTFRIFCEFFGIFLFLRFCSCLLRGFGGFQKFFDEVQRSPYRLKNSAKIEKNKPRVRKVG